MRSALLTAALLAGCAPAALAPGAGEPPPPLAFPAEVGDTAVVRGVLENGLSYYVRRNAEPPGRAELRLVVNVGSVLEDDDQRGLAHFLEHMAFNGTRRFARDEIVGYMERVGMRFGPDVNAYTGLDETVYLLHVPMDTAGVLETGIAILADWAGGMVLDSAEVERERGVVMEEWRRSRGAGARVADRQIPFLLAGSRYAERLPIGDPEVLATFPHAALHRFHARWYRPELMAVVAVGDFDPAAVEATIRRELGALPPSAEPVTRPTHPVPPGEGPRYRVTADPELSGEQVSVNWLSPARRDTTAAGRRARVAEGVYVGMLAERMNEITLRPDAPFLDVGSYHGGFLRPLRTLAMSAAVPEGGAERGLAALLAEVERAARHGFAADELERERARLLRSWERIHAERGKTTSAQYAGQYAEHFLTGGVLRTVEDEFAFQQVVLPALTLAEVDAAARRYAAHRDRVVLVSGPGESAPPVAEARLAAVADSVLASELAPPETRVVEGSLLPRDPVAGRVVEETVEAEAGVVRWTLSNGARVVLRPTDFREDEVLFAATSLGGSSLVPDSLFRHGQTATAAVQVGGVGELSLTDLQRRLAGRAASVGPFVGELTEGMQGAASPADLELLLQLAHLYFTAPRRDETAWEAYLQRAREMLRNRDRSPDQVFADTLSAILTGGHPRGRPFTAATIDSLDLDRALEIYRERFADASDFTFYFVGTFDPDSLRPLVERYLASLPAAGRTETWRDVGMQRPAGVVRRTLRRGVEPQARTVLVFTGPTEFSREAVADAQLLAAALQLRLRERLRDELGGTYAVTVSGAVRREPYPRYSLSIAFASSPERIEEMVEGVWEELRQARESGISGDVVDRVREAQRRQRELAVRDNSSWLAMLMQYDQYGWDARTFLDLSASSRIGPDRLRDAAGRYLDPERYVHLTLLPAEEG